MLEKLQLVLFDWSNDTSANDIKVDGSFLEEKSSFKIVGLSFSPKLNWGSYISSIAKTALLWQNLYKFCWFFLCKFCRQKYFNVPESYTTACYYSRADWNGLYNDPRSIEMFSGSLENWSLDLFYKVFFSWRYSVSLQIFHTLLHGTLLSCLGSFSWQLLGNVGNATSLQHLAHQQNVSSLSISCRY